MSDLADAVRSLGNRDRGLGWLEGVGIALAGEHLHSPVGEQIQEQRSALTQAVWDGANQVSDSLDKVAAAIERLADVIEAQGETS